MSGPSRRRVLQGAAAVLALPFLESALPRGAWGQGYTPPTRLIVWYVPNGIQMDWFTPSSTGFGYDLPEMLEPLALVQPHVSVLTGFAQIPAEDLVAGDHARGTGSFLTCTKIRHTAGNDIENGVSVDQRIAQHLAGQTVFPSLQVGISDGGNTGDCTAGYSCAYTRNISWAGPSTPLPGVTDPAVLFDRMFGGDPTLAPEVAARRTILRASVLDDVADQTASLALGLSADDKLKLDEYVTGVRELETRIQALGRGGCEPPERPQSNLSFPEHVEAMNELMVLALECDLTRVITFMLGPAASNQTFDFVGVPGAHHQISHHQGNDQNLSQLRTIGRWEVERFASMVERLEAVPDGSGTLLDSTLACFSSEIEDGDIHSHRNLPVLLAGSGNGVHAPGRHVSVGDDRPFSDLCMAFLDAFGVDDESFGDDSSGPIDLTG